MVLKCVLIIYLGPMQAELRTGQVRKPPAVNDIYVPLQRLYKNKQWWGKAPKEGKSFSRPNRQLLRAQFKKQITQIWQVCTITTQYSLMSYTLYCYFKVYFSISQF